MSRKPPAQLQREIDEVLSRPSGLRSHATVDAFEAAKAERDVIDAEAVAAGNVLKSFPSSGPLGLVPEAVRLSPEYRSAKARFDKAFARLRAFNTVFVKKFAKELKAERDQRYSKRTSGAAHATTKMKAGDFTKLATATSVPKIEKFINEFAYSTNYRVDPDTLQITNPVKAPPESWFVMPYRGGYLFGRKN